MNILALPEVFLRDLMRTMEIKDRLQLRLTCRALEKLVADTHAGSFYEGRIVQAPDKNTFSIHIGLAHFNDIEASEIGFRQCINLRNRFFSGIKFNYFHFNHNDSITIEFIRQFTLNFTINELSFHVKTVRQLEMSLQIMSDFSLSKFKMRLDFMPETELLQALSPLEELTILDHTGYINDPMTWHIDSELFFNLLGKHKTMQLDNVIMTSDDLDRTVQIITTASTERYLQLKLKKSTVSFWLMNHGIADTFREGDRHGEFEVVNVPNSSRRSNYLDLRYTHLKTSKLCFISIFGHVWEDSGVGHIRMTISNTE